MLQECIEPGDFITFHDDFLTVDGFHNAAFIHACRLSEFMLHGHLAVTEDIDCYSVLQFEGPLCLISIYVVGS